MSNKKKENQLFERTHFGPEETEEIVRGMQEKVKINNQLLKLELQKQIEVLFIM